MRPSEFPVDDEAANLTMPSSADSVYGRIKFEENEELNQENSQTVDLLLQGDGSLQILGLKVGEDAAVQVAILNDDDVIVAVSETIEVEKGPEDRIAATLELNALRAALTTGLAHMSDEGLMYSKLRARIFGSTSTIYVGEIELPAALVSNARLPVVRPTVSGILGREIPDRFRGYLDAFGETGEGWALDYDGSKTVELDIYAGTFLLGRISTSLARGDVRDIANEEAYTGFKVSFADLAAACRPEVRDAIQELSANFPDFPLKADVRIGATGDTLPAAIGVPTAVKAGDLAAMLNESVIETAAESEALSSAAEIRSPTLLFYPDYTSTNPYQEALYSALHDAFDVSPGTIEQAADLARAGQQVIFHLHWPEPIFAGVRTPDKFRARGEKFLEWVAFFQGQGGRLFITIHNALPHNSALKEEWKWFQGRLCATADRIHLHSEAGLDHLQQFYFVPREKSLILAHGNYEGYYPMTMERATSRDLLDIPEDVLTYAFVGQLRPYKGLDELLTAFQTLARSRSDLKLLIAGKPVHPTPEGHWERIGEMSEVISVTEGFIKDENLQIYFSAADVIVLPYRDILTSGSVLLAASFGKPVILPRLETLVDVRGRGFTLDYDPNEENGLRDAMKRFAALSQDERLAMCTAALTFAQSQDWPSISSRLKTALQDIVRLTQETQQIGGRDVAFRTPALPHSPRSIGIAIVNYHSEDDISQLLKTMPHSVDGRQVQVFILDNGQNPYELNRYQQIPRQMTLVAAADNLGYAEGNNLLLELMQEAGCAYGMILNPDMLLTKDTLRLLIEQSQEMPEAVLSPLVLKDGNKVSFAGGFVKRSDDISIIQHLDGEPATRVPETAYEVDVLNGCAVFAPMDVFKKIGPIPADYFLYFEETDWFMTMMANDIKRVMVPQAKVFHTKKSHGTRVPSLYYVYYLIRNSFVFNQKYGGSLPAIARRFKTTFVSGWATKIQKLSPNFLPIFQRAVDAAIADGQQLLSGRADVGERLDLQDGTTGSIETLGFVEKIGTGQIEGWFCYRDIQRSEGWIGGASVWLIIDDVPVLEMPSTIERQDVASGGYSLQCGFSIPTPKGLFDGGLHKLEVRNSANGKRLPFLDGALQRIQAFTKTPPALASDTKIQGRIDGVIDGKISGWAYDPDMPDREVLVDVELNGRLFQSVSAAFPRPDLQKAGLGNGNHGLILPIPIDILTSRKIQARMIQNEETDQVFKKEVSYDYGREFDISFTPKEYLAWAWKHFETPVGAYHEASNVRHYFETSKDLHFSRRLDREAEPLVSVIMPMFNRQSVVTGSIMSVVAQHYQNWELLVVDDGSRDSSADVVSRLIEKLDDPRVRLIRAETNGGVSVARNLALDVAKGDLIAYLDSDNEWYPECLSILAGAMHGRPDFQSCYAGQEIWEYLPSSTKPELRSVRANPFNRSKLEDRNYIDLNVFMHRRSLFDTLGGFRSDMRRLVDWELILRYTEEFPALFVPVMLNKYFVNLAENQITRVELFDENLTKLKSIKKRLGKARAN